MPTRFHLSFFEIRGQAPVLKHLTGSYLAHTQGKKHQINLARRAAREKQVSRQTCGDCIIIIVPHSVANSWGWLWCCDSLDMVRRSCHIGFWRTQQFSLSHKHLQARRVLWVDPGIHGHFWQISISNSGPRKTVKIGRPGYRVTKDMVCEIFEIQTRSHGWAQATAQCLCHFWSWHVSVSFLSFPCLKIKNLTAMQCLQNLHSTLLEVLYGYRLAIIFANFESLQCFLWYEVRWNTLFRCLQMH